MSKPSILKTKIIPTIVALILLLAAIIQIFVPLLGKETSAREIKREIVERDRDEHPNLQYEWAIYYEYTDSQGGKHTGVHRQNGNATGSNVRAPGTVYYLSFLPSWNVANINNGAGNLLSGLIFLLLGILILVATFKKGGKKKKAKTQAIQSQNTHPLPGNYPNQYPGQCYYPNPINNSNQTVFKNQNSYPGQYYQPYPANYPEQLDNSNKTVYPNQIVKSQFVENNHSSMRFSDQQQTQYNQYQKDQWQCPSCRKYIQGNFCNNCGFPKRESADIETPV
ncbi:MAG TPA: hypothetical protein GXZ76_05400 [Clostridiaceae bacterium]|nr:hypothetical protein [Clostridiaceae bacterium]